MAPKSAGTAPNRSRPQEPPHAAERRDVVRQQLEVEGGLERAAAGRAAGAAGGRRPSGPRRGSRGRRRWPASTAGCRPSRAPADTGAGAAGGTRSGRCRRRRGPGRAATPAAAAARRCRSGRGGPAGRRAHAARRTTRRIIPALLHEAADGHARADRVVQRIVDGQQIAQLGRQRPPGRRRRAAASGTAAAACRAGSRSRAWRAAAPTCGWRCRRARCASSSPRCCRPCRGPAPPAGCGAIGSASASCGRCRHRCDPGTTRVAPLSGVKSSSSHTVLHTQ